MKWTLRRFLVTLAVVVTASYTGGWLSYKAVDNLTSGACTPINIDP